MQCFCYQVPVAKCFHSCYQVQSFLYIQGFYHLLPGTPVPATRCNLPSIFKVFTCLLLGASSPYYQVHVLPVPVTRYMYFQSLLPGWGEPERAPHLSHCCAMHSCYIYIPGAAFPLYSRCLQSCYQVQSLPGVEVPVISCLHSCVTRCLQSSCYQMQSSLYTTRCLHTCYQMLAKLLLQPRCFQSLIRSWYCSCYQALCF